jgi:hypothetical protein
MIEDDGRELPQPLGANLCPSATQAMRIGKLYMYEQNPEYTGSISSGLQALELISDPVFTMDLAPENDIERVAICVGAIEFDAESTTTQAAIMIPFEGATTWVAAVDEQEQVEIPPTLLSDVNDVTLDVTASVELLSNSAPILRFEWEAAGAATLPDSYTQQVEVSLADEEDWSGAQVNQEDDHATYGPVADGALYDWRIRNLAAGKTFDWQESVTPVTVTVDTVAPMALIAFSASDGTGQFVANFGTENDTHLARVAIYKVASGGTLDRDADIVAPAYAVAPGISYGLPITSGTGTFDIYAEPFNVSGIAGPLAGPDEAVVS